MEIKVDELLNFCAYYTLAKTATKMPHTPNPPSARKIEPTSTKMTKTKRQKVEVLQSKRPKRSKIEHVPSHSNNKKSVSPIRQHQQRQIAQNGNKDKGFDLNFFVSHMASQVSQSNTWNQPSKVRQVQHSQVFSKRNESNLQNYQTFGKSAGKPTQYETYQSKIKRQNRGNLTERYQRGQHFEKQEFMVSQFFMQPESKQSHLTEANSWMGPSQKVFKSQYIDIEPNKTQTSYISQMQNYQPTESKVISRQQFTTGSRISAKYSPDSRLSKSRTKHQRKKSERPFYDPSKLTVQQESESMVRDNSPEQNQLAQSFMTVEETPSRTCPKRMISDDGKRQTSTTAPPLRNNRQLKPVYRMQRNETDLDDALGETLTELSHRKVPLSLQLKMKHQS